MAKQVMLDIETLGSGPTDVAVFEVGMVAFDLDGRADFDRQLTVYLSLEEALRTGRITPNTLQWWLTDPSISPAVRERLRRVWLEHKLPPDSHLTGDISFALHLVSKFFDHHGASTVWANGVTFDVGIMDHQFRRLRRRPPWKYSQIMCLRPIRRLFPDLWEIERKRLEHTGHCAVADCHSAVHFLRAADSRLRPAGLPGFGAVDG